MHIAVAGNIGFGYRTQTTQTSLAALLGALGGPQGGLCLRLISEKCQVSRDIERQPSAATIRLGQTER